MTSEPKIVRPSSPREFFARLYGHLENNKEDSNNKEQDQLVHHPKKTSNVITPMPVLASPIPFFLPSGNDAHLSAAAAGLTAFRKFLYKIFLLFYFFF